MLKTGFNQDLKYEYDYLTPDMELTIENKDHIKDLGIWMSSSGDFSFHITKVISKVRQRIGWTLLSENSCGRPTYPDYLTITPNYGVR